MYVNVLIYDVNLSFKILETTERSLCIFISREVVARTEAALCQGPGSGLNSPRPPLYPRLWPRQESGVHTIPGTSPSPAPLWLLTLLT